MTKCSICGSSAELVQHFFAEGPMRKPTRRWSYWATLYHHPETHAPYCGPMCATKALG